MHGDAVHAVPDLRLLLRNAVGLQSAIDRPPALTGVVAAKRAGGRDRDVKIRLGSRGIEDDGVQAHAAGAGLPRSADGCVRKRGKFFPVVPAVGGAKERGIFDSGVDQIGIA